MQDVASPGLSSTSYFGRGLDAVVRDSPAEGLPGRAQLFPLASPQQESRRFFQRPLTFDQQLLHASLQGLADDSLLVPSNFEAGLAEVLDLARAAHLAAAGSEALARGIRVLEEELALRELASTYRASLYAA